MFHVTLILLLLLDLVALATVAVGLPGNWFLVLSAVLFEWWREEEVFGVPVLVAVTALAGLGEVFELLGGAVGSSRHGGTRRGALGALGGGIVGGIAGTLMIPFPVLGTIAGVCSGAFLGSVFLELTGGRGVSESLRSGKGAVLGHLTGLVAKVAVGIAIWVTLAVAGFA